MPRREADIIVHCVWEDSLMISMAGLSDPEEIIYCNNCKHWNREDGAFADFDGKEWHQCKQLDAFLSASGDPPMTPGYFYCGNGEKNA